MWLWMSLLILATTPQPVIFLHPPWTTVFKGESVNLTCHGYHFSAPGETTWYLWDSEQKTELKSKRNTVTVHVSGKYRCQVPGSSLSEPVTLLFSSDDLILQTPYSVFEADSVVLRCRGKTEAVVESVNFYRNKKLLDKYSQKSFEFHIKHAGLKDNGAYYCTGSKKGFHYVTSKAVELQVQELFPEPVLTISSLKPTEGSPVTLTCKTCLPSQRSNVNLKFNFQSDTLWSGWRSSPEFQITSVWKKNSGVYWCEIQEQTTFVRKKSKKSYMSVQRIIANIQIRTYPVLELVFEGEELVLTCSVDGVPAPFRVEWHRRHVWGWKKEIASNLNELKISKVKMSDAGEYYCVVLKERLSFKSKPVDITVKEPVSIPVFTLHTRGARVLKGHMVTLHCQVQRGSHPILYQFFHNDELIKDLKETSSRIKSYSFSLRAEDSGSYYCTVNNGQGAQRSNIMQLSVTVPVSPPLLTLQTPRAKAFVGDTVTLRCETQRGSHNISYKFYHMDVILEERSIPFGEGAFFSFPLKEAHSGSYYCTASNGFGSQRSEAVNLFVAVPVPRPVLTLRTPQAQVVVGNLVEFHCEAQRGSPPILYQFYHEDVSLGSSSAPLGGGVSFNLSLTTEHSGKYYCEADNGLGAQHSDRVSLSVKVPVSLPALTLRAPRAQTMVGDVVELHCEVQSGSLPIIYRFYHEDVILKNSSVTSEGGTSFNLSLTAEHSGNYSCQAINDVGDQLSEVVEIYITGLTESRSGSVTAGVTGGLLSMMCLAAVTLLLYHWLLKKAAGGPSCDPTRNHSEFNPQEPTYSNVPSYLELQPVYSNVNLSGGDVVYSEVKSIKEKNKPTVASEPRSAKDEGSSVIYSEVKVTSTSASRTQPLASSDPHI